MTLVEKLQDTTHKSHLKRIDKNINKAILMKSTLNKNITLYSCKDANSINTGF